MLVEGARDRLIPENEQFNNQPGVWARAWGGNPLMANGNRLNRIALVVGGGPAPGINGVISAVTIEAVNNGITVIGIRNCFKEMVQAKAYNIRKLTIDDVKDAALRGGSMLGTSRTNPAKSPEDMANVLKVLRGLE